MSEMRNAFAAGYENLSAWADLLDRINVFPVADGDTGTNLRISLAPLRDCPADNTLTAGLLARSATGNSGNIAAAFFQEFSASGGFADLAKNAARGREMAWQALARPQAGTMLSVFDSLSKSLADRPDPETLYPLLCKDLREAVLSTAHLLPSLREAGVVDSGALGMYVFFEGFFRRLTAEIATSPPLPELFAGRLAINAGFQAGSTDCFCVNALVETGTDPAGTGEELAELGESVVVLPAESGFKVHIHTADPQRLRARLSSLGKIVDWSDESMAESAAGFADPANRPIIHIMTDAAGSIPRRTARRHGITLLDSYILARDASRPESLCSPAEIYSLMRSGVRVRTAQASIFERHQHYRSVSQQFGPTLYLCVGSAFTGNHDIALKWKKEHDPDNLLRVIDTGAASGRLGLIALLAARCAEHAATPEEVVAFVEKTMAVCEEYVFIDQLQYLAAGGRISRAGGFFADLLHMKPVISPAGDGVRKEGVVHGKRGQLSFAKRKLRERFAAAAAPVILLQHSDNQEWVTKTVLPAVQSLLPSAEIILAPLSLTSGVHMGPGTWSIAWAGEV